MIFIKFIDNVSVYNVNCYFSGTDVDLSTYCLPDCPYQLKTCPEENHTTYRTFDGSCNNLKNSLIGKAFIPLKRYLQPDYGNGLFFLKNWSILKIDYRYIEYNIIYVYCHLQIYRYKYDEYKIMIKLSHIVLHLNKFKNTK